MLHRVWINTINNKKYSDMIFFLKPKPKREPDIHYFSFSLGDETHRRLLLNSQVYPSHLQRDTVPLHHEGLIL